MMKKIDNIFSENVDRDLSIYIHIPFCERKCLYCDFLSGVSSEQKIKEYFKYLLREIDLYSTILEKRNIASIFIGGGTPSSVNPKYIGGIFKKLSNYTDFSNVEISIESNPNSLDEEKIESYLDFGINRFSLGVQSFNDALLSEIGRVHTRDIAIEAIKNLSKRDLNFSIDLMLALPHQKLKDIEDSIEFIEKYSPKHISYYSLILEENTPLYSMYFEDSSAFPDENLDREMYHYVVDELENIGYKQYEISNFSKPNFESIHNLRYWNLEDYIGIGLGASSNIGRYRYNNSRNFKDYYDLVDKKILPIEYFEELSKKDRINEYMMLGIRKNSGVSIDSANERFGIDIYSYYDDAIEKNLNLKNILIRDDRISLTKRGRDLSNQVELDFFK